MKSILKNSNGNAVSTGGKLLGKPEGVNPLQTLITGKGANGGYYLFRDYTGDNVDFISGIDWSANNNCQYMFYNCYNLTTIPLLDTSNVTNMSNMFNSCSKLTTIPQLDTSNVTSMTSMFNNCRNITTIPQLDTSNVTSVGSMFSSCQKLNRIDLTSIDKITSSNFFFNGCSSLTKVIIRNMEVIPNLSSDAFRYAYHFLGTVDSTYNPEGLKDGRIYIPDDYVEQLKQATNWSEYGDIIVPLSTLEE